MRTRKITFPTGEILVKRIKTKGTIEYMSVNGRNITSNMLMTIETPSNITPINNIIDNDPHGNLVYLTHDTSITRKEYMDDIYELLPFKIIASRNIITLDTTYSLPVLVSVVFMQKYMRYNSFNAYKPKPDLMTRTKNNIYGMMNKLIPNGDTVLLEQHSGKYFVVLDVYLTLLDIIFNRSLSRIKNWLSICTANNRTIKHLITQQTKQILDLRQKLLTSLSSMSNPRIVLISRENEKVDSNYILPQIWSTKGEYSEI